MTNEYMNYADFIKSQNRDGILSHPDIQQRMLMIMGNQKDKKLELSKDEITKVAQHYMKMCYALTTIRWCNGETLGVARQKSLEQMNGFVKSKKNIAHPMNKYLLSIHGRISREVAETNMTDKNSDSKLGLDTALTKKWAEQATTQFKESMKILNDIYKKYMPEKDLTKMPAAKSFQNGQQKVQDMLKQQQIIKQKILQQQMEQRIYQRAA